MKRNAKFGAVVLALLLVTSSLSGVAGAWTADASPENEDGSLLAQETTTTQTNQTTNATNETATVTFGDQPSNGSAVVVNETNLSAGGYVVVFAENGSVLGNTSYLEPGIHENLTVALDTPLDGSQVVIAVPHLDTDDDQVFDFNATRVEEVGAANVTDRPYLGSNGLPFSQVAFVTVGNETTNRTTTESRVAPARR